MKQVTKDLSAETVTVQINSVESSGPTADKSHLADSIQLVTWISHNAILVGFSGNSSLVFEEIESSPSSLQTLINFWRLRNPGIEVHDSTFFQESETRQVAA
jgi:hypothetical protein